jgi:hypothetical protein
VIRVPVLAPLAAALLLAGCASAAPADPGPAPASAEASSDAFRRLTALAGTWSTIVPEGGAPATVTYRVVGGGSAVEEDLFPGTPHEMISMYHLDGPRLLMTHYCAAGNQPTMILVPGDDPAVLRFDFLRATNLKDPGAGHMRSLVFEVPGGDRAKASWTYWEGGKAGETVVLDLRRAPK